MRSVGIGLIVLLVMLMVGCASGPSVKEADYDNMPGSGDHMAKGPGLMAVGQKDDYNGGYTVYSDNPNQKALINPNKGKTQRPATVANSTAGRSPSQATSSQQQNYRQFQEFQQFKQFQQMPKDSAEYQQFRQWQEWKHYQQWKASQQSAQ